MPDSSEEVSCPICGELKPKEVDYFWATLYIKLCCCHQDGEAKLVSAETDTVYGCPMLVTFRLSNIIGLRNPHQRFLTIVS